MLLHNWSISKSIYVIYSYNSKKNKKIIAKNKTYPKILLLLRRQIYEKNNLYATKSYG